MGYGAVERQMPTITFHLPVGLNSLNGKRKSDAGSGDLVDETLNTKNIEFAEGGLDDSIVREGNALFVDFAVSTPVNQFAERLQVWLF